MTHALERSTTGSSGLMTAARGLLLALSFVFFAGAVVQFFLAGLSVFDTPLRWEDHRSLGHVLGLIPYVLWIPAVLGRVGVKFIVGSLALFFLYMAQYAFVNIEEPVVQALHPVNGVVMLLISFMIVRGTFEVMRQARREESGAS